MDVMDISLAMLSVCWCPRRYRPDSLDICREWNAKGRIVVISTDGLGPGVDVADLGGGKDRGVTMTGGSVWTGDSFLGSEMKLSIFLRDALVLEPSQNAGFMMRRVL